MTEQLQLTDPASAVPAEYLDVWVELERQRRHRGQQLAELADAAAEAAAMSDEASRALTRALELGARQALAETEAALRRLAAGEFGVCHDCGSTIAAERLEVLPTTRYCTPCQRGMTDAARRPRWP